MIAQGATWISFENGEGFRIKSNEIEPLTSPLKVEQLSNQSGNGLIELQGKASEARLWKDDNHFIGFEFDLDLQFINRSNRPALIWNTDTYGNNGRFWIKGTPVALTREDALAHHYIIREDIGPNSYRNAQWRNWRCALDRSQPPESLIKILKPGEIWAFPKTKYSVRFDKISSSDTQIWSWDQIKGKNPLWIRIILEAWPILLEYRNDDSFGYMLRRRWQNYGILQLDHLTSEPMPLKLPD